jgi:hypothetical protein
VNNKVNTILQTLNVGSSSNYTKIKAVEDYIKKNVNYDDTLTKFTAYDALSSGLAVCQGYSLLAYKMLSELGVPVRFISGITAHSSNGHAWNIVKIGDCWYNVDVTFDDTTNTELYFLKCNASYTDRSRDEVFTTPAFNEAYPMSPVDYDPSNEIITVSGSNGGGTGGLMAKADNTPSAWAVDGVSALLARGVVPSELQSGYHQNITRAEFTALMVNVYEYAKGPYKAAAASPFTDISGSSYIEQIIKGYTLGLISGTSASTFNPNGTLTREQCAKLISTAVSIINGSPIASNAALPFDDAAQIHSWALDYVRYAYQNELMNGTGTSFNPLGNLTREQALLIAERMIEKYNW